MNEVTASTGNTPNGHVAGQDRIWDYYQNDAADTFDGSFARLAYLAKQLDAPAKILDIGVGAGIFERLAAARGLELYALDPSERSIASLRQRFGLGERAQVGYSTAIPFADNSFDAVVVSEVLEHLATDVLSGTLLEIKRVLKPGGLLLGTVPARERLSDNIVVCPDCGSCFHRWGHMQSFDVTRLSGLLSEHFDVDRVFERRFITWSILNWKGKAIALVQLALHSVGVRGTNTNVVFHARKPSSEQPR